MVANAAFQHSVLSECNSGITVCCDVIPRGMENVGGCVRSSYLDGRRNIAIALIGDRPCSDRAERALDSGVRARAAALRMHGFARQTFAEDLIFRLWFLLG